MQKSKGNFVLILNSYSTLDYEDPMAREPFHGLKVLDFGWIGVGPITARYFGDNGATVIRIESLTRFDGLRMAPPYKDAKPGLNNSQFFDV